MKPQFKFLRKEFGTKGSKREYIKDSIYQNMKYKF